MFAELLSEISRDGRKRRLSKLKNRIVGKLFPQSRSRHRRPPRIDVPRKYRRVGRKKRESFL